MRNEDDIKEADPHYREMSKVIISIWHMNIPCLVLTDVQCCDSTPMAQRVTFFFLFYRDVACHYLQDQFNFAKVNISLFPNPHIFLIPTL